MGKLVFRLIGKKIVFLELIQRYFKCYAYSLAFLEYTKIYHGNKSSIEWSPNPSQLIRSKKVLLFNVSWLMYASKLKKNPFTFWNAILNVLLHKRLELTNLKLKIKKKFKNNLFLGTHQFSCQKAHPFDQDFNESVCLWPWQGALNIPRSCFHQNPIALWLKLKKQLVYNYCAIIPWVLQLLCNYPLENTRNQ